MSDVVDPYDQTGESDEVPPEPPPVGAHEAFHESNPVETIGQLAGMPTQATGQPPSEASVAEAQRVAALAMLQEAGMPPERKQFLRDQLERGELDAQGLAAYVQQYEAAPQTLVPATEAQKDVGVGAGTQEYAQLEQEAEAVAAAADAEARPEPEEPPPADGELLPEQSVLQRMWDHPEIPQEQKEDWAARFQAGTLNETMLGVLVDSYDEEDDQTDQSDDPIAEAKPVEVFEDRVVIEAEDGEQLQLMRASDLAPPDEEEIPPPPEQSLPPPPGSTHGIFYIEKNRFGAGTWGIDLVHPDGTHEAVMVYLARTVPDWSGAEVADWLLRNGLPQDHAVRLGRQRGNMQEGAEVVLQYPGVQKLMQEEERHIELKDEFSKAYVAARKKKDKS